MIDIAGLRKRVEAASGPDRELDADLWWHFDRAAAGRHYHTGRVGLPQPLPETLTSGGLGRAAVQQAAPKFTASIEASLTFVEKVLPGWHWSLDSFGEATLFDSTGAFLVHADYEFYGHNKHIPLAILSALLAALEARDAPTT